MGFLRLTQAKLPENWPSALHHKCTERKCAYANPPQVASGRYVCLGGICGSPCNGTYNVTANEARASVAWLNRDLERSNEEKSRLMAQVQEARQRKDQASLQQHKDQLAVYLRVLKADEEGDESGIDAYIAQVGVPSLRKSTLVWQEHIEDVEKAVYGLKRLLDELSQVMH